MFTMNEVAIVRLVAVVCVVAYMHLTLVLVDLVCDPGRLIVRGVA